MSQPIPLPSRCAFELCRLLCLQILSSLLPAAAGGLFRAGFLLSALWRDGLGPALSVAFVAPFTRCLLFGESFLTALAELPGNFLLVLLLQKLPGRRFFGALLLLSLALLAQQGALFLGQQCLLSLLPASFAPAQPFWLSGAGAYAVLLWHSFRLRRPPRENSPILLP